MNKIENKSYYYIKKRGSSCEKSFLPKIALVFRQFLDSQFYVIVPNFVKHICNFQRR